MVRLWTRGVTPGLTVLSVVLIAASAWTSRSPAPVAGLEAALLIAATTMVLAIGVTLWWREAGRINAAEAADLARLDSDNG